MVNSLEEFDERVRAVEPYVKWVQLDVADGDFAPNKTWGDPSQLRDYNTEVLIEAHLMVSEPEKIIDEWLIVRSVRRIYFHYEATNQHKEIIKKIKDAGKEVGVGLLLETSITVLNDFIEDLDAVLLFDGALGFYGGKFDEEKLLPKINALRKLAPNVIIEIDGGMNPQNAKKAVEAGVNAIVSGSFIWQHKGGAKEAIGELNKVVTSNG
ncbi:MAG: hypothetical protein A2728_01955 [Candidatus Spechtbacteria bacterium RIFCSPHIGHO2_01_FULL_38_11]|nr:MAG: hypothetical protein A2728_01955 [Candidatus Spechtbacteria bacterium RIFCSPHIGHO2_01_FULL_38_11]